jgi:hypothetical protein
MGERPAQENDDVHQDLPPPEEPTATSKPIHDPQHLVSEGSEASVQTLQLQLLNQMEASQYASSAEAQSDRIFNVGLEYWKSQLEFYKQLVTMNLIAVGGFGAVLGGVFKDPEAWALPSPFRPLLIVATFICFLGSALLSMDATVQALNNILRMREVRTEEQLQEMLEEFFTKWPTTTFLPLWFLRGRRFVRQSRASHLLFLLGLFCFVSFAFYSVLV